MDYHAAKALAGRKAAELNEPVDVWRHAGGVVAGRRVAAQDRYVAVSRSYPDPKYVWTLYETVNPSDRTLDPSALDSAVQRVENVLTGVNAYSMTLKRGVLVAVASGFSDADLEELQAAVHAWRKGVGSA